MGDVEHVSGLLCQTNTFLKKINIIFNEKQSGQTPCVYFKSSYSYGEFDIHKCQ